MTSSWISYSRPWRASLGISSTAVLPSSSGAKPEALESALGHGSPAGDRSRTRESDLPTPCNVWRHWSGRSLPAMQGLNALGNFHHLAGLRPSVGRWETSVQRTSRCNRTKWMPGPMATVRDGQHLLKATVAARIIIYSGRMLTESCRAGMAVHGNDPFSVRKNQSLLSLRLTKLCVCMMHKRA